MSTQVRNRSADLSPKGQDYYSSHKLNIQRSKILELTGQDF